MNLTSNNRVAIDLTMETAIGMNIGIHAFMDNIYKLSISDPPDFDGQYGFDILMDLVSAPNSIQNDLYVGLDGVWYLLKEMTFTATDLTAFPLLLLTRAVESDSNIGLAWTAQRTTGYLDRVKSREFVAKYYEVRAKITARQGAELKLSDYVSLEDAIIALNAAGAGSQLNINESIVTSALDTPPQITVDDIVIYSDNQSYIKLGVNNTGSHVFCFLGDNVHIMGVSVNIDKNNQINTFSGIHHISSTDFSVIGCDVRNSNGYNYKCEGSSDGIYGACIGTVSGDDVFTAVAASSNIMYEFCTGGCSDRVFGSPAAFELEDGDDHCTIYKCIAFGQIETASFTAHIHPGEPSVTNMLMNECVSIYNTYSFSFAGDNLIASTIEDSVLLNCKDIYSFSELYSHSFKKVKNCTIQNNKFYPYSDSHRPTIQIQDCENVEALNNVCSFMYLKDSELLKISENTLYVESPSSMGITLSGVNNSQIGVNNFRVSAPVNPYAIYLSNSDNNVINSNILVTEFARGIYFTGTSSGNVGSGNNLTKALVEVFDDSTGVNVIT